MSLVHFYVILIDVAGNNPPHFRCHYNFLEKKMALRPKAIDCMILLLVLFLKLASASMKMSSSAKTHTTEEHFQEAATLEGLLAALSL